MYLSSVYTVGEGSAGGLSLDAVVDLPQSRLDILLRVKDYFGGLKGIRCHFLWAIHEPSLGEGHEGTHLPKIHSYPLLEAGTDDLSEGYQSCPYVWGRE